MLYFTSWSVCVGNDKGKSNVLWEVKMTWHESSLSGIILLDYKLRLAKSNPLYSSRQSKCLSGSPKAEFSRCLKWFYILIKSWMFAFAMNCAWIKCSSPCSKFCKMTWAVFVFNWPCTSSSKPRHPAVLSFYSKSKLCSINKALHKATLWFVFLSLFINDGILCVFQLLLSLEEPEVICSI